MSEPEIARRCAACGASVRQSAMFCPQCGSPVSQTQTTTATAVTETIADVPAPTLPPAKVHEDGVRARVERLRQVSSIMIDQAAYDPSLRFLLVAAAMFLIFLVLLILSKVIG